MSAELIAAGALIGLLVGMTGMGGGSLLTPLLVLVFGFQPQLAVGTDLLHGAIFKTVAAARHRRLGTVEGRLSAWMLLGSAPMSLLGVAASVQLHAWLGDQASSVQSVLLGVALVLGACGVVAKAFARGAVVGEAPLVMTRRNRVAALLIGAVGGFVVGLTSVGSGVFFGLTLLVVFPLRAAKVVGTDIVHAAALLWVAGLGHFAVGNVDMPAVLSLLVGSVPGVLLGSQMTVTIPDRVLRIVLACVLAASGFALLAPPPQVLVVAVAIAVPMLVLGMRRSRAPEADAAILE